MGNPDFAVLSLEELAASNHDILAVVTNPPKPSGRGRKIIETPVALCATELGLHVLQIDDLNNNMPDLPSVTVATSFAACSSFPDFFLRICVCTF